MFGGFQNDAELPLRGINNFLFLLVNRLAAVSDWAALESSTQVLAEKGDSLLHARGGTLLSATTQLSDPRNDEIQGADDVVVTG